MRPTSRIALQGLIFLAVLGWVYWPTLVELYDTWANNPEYSHGMLVPFFAVYLLYRRLGVPVTTPTRPWPIIACGVLALAAVLRLAGSATGFLPLEGLSLVLCLAGLTVLAAGRDGLARFWPPVVFLLFMIPLPYEASRLMGAELQRVGTIASTFLLQCCGQPAIADGNRILIGDVTLNVVEACSGLRMLVTFFAFSVAAVFLMDRHWVVKCLVLGGAIPIALLTNVLRITATGLAHIWLHDSPTKTKVLEFIHDFNGWMMMPIGLTFLLFELWLFKHLLIERGSLPSDRSTASRTQTVSTPRKKPRFASVIQMPVSR
jgi:exosortase